jgi:hypothetical protein
MGRVAILFASAAICAVPFVAGSALAADAPAKTAAYKAPRTTFGQPDLGEYWTNATITTESRPSALGERLVYTAEEVKKLESAVVTEVDEGNQATDPNAPPPSVGGDVKPGLRPEFAAAGGNVGGYNRGWLEPGSTVMRVNGQPRTSLITTPNGRAPARKPQPPAPPSATPATTPVRMGQFDNPEIRGLGERCILSFGRNAGPPMFANGFYNNNYHFNQSRDAVAIEVEMVHDVRVIRLNQPHRTDGVRPYMGDAVGHWEGDTLVVETTNIPRSQAYAGSWENLKVTERFTRVGKDRLYYQFTIEDPTSWDKPWGGEYEFAPLNGRVMEYACHEGNYALEGILAGARNDERMAAEKAAAEKPRAEAPGAAAVR